MAWHLDTPLEGPGTERVGEGISDGVKPDAQGPTPEGSTLQQEPDRHHRQQQRAQDRTYQLDRLASGVAGLDTVLRGGFFEGGLYLIVGEPGTGKTILANQLCFNHIVNDGRAVYVTLLVETHGRMLAHLSSLDFFNPEAVGQKLQYISGAVILRENGLDELLALLGGVVRDHQATMLVVEGLETAQAVAGSELAFKRFLQSLQILVEVLGCTTFLVSQSPLIASSSSSSSSAGRAVVDGLIELSDKLTGIRRVRGLEILKLRGSDYLRDTHAFTITDAGITVYPRTEKLVSLSPPSPPASLATERTRLGFGTNRLDEMLHGGPFVGSSTMLLGTPGSGKTVLGLHFLAAGAGKGERGLYFGFDEPPEWLIEKADKIGLNFSNHVTSGLIDIAWQAPLDNILDALAEQMLTLVRTRRVARLFIDGLSGLERAVDYPDRMFAFFAALVLQLRSLGVTTVFSTEIAQFFGPEVELPAAYASGTTDNILFLRYVELRSHLHRLISIMKMRDSAYETAIREFVINEHGIDVAATFESAEAILTGLAHPTGAVVGGTVPSTPGTLSIPPERGPSPSASADSDPSSTESTPWIAPDPQASSTQAREATAPAASAAPATDEVQPGVNIYPQLARDEGNEEDRDGLGGGAESKGTGQ